MFFKTIKFFMSFKLFSKLITLFYFFCTIFSQFER